MYKILKKPILAILLFLLSFSILGFINPVNVYADTSSYIFHEDEDLKNQAFEFLITPTKNGGCGLTIEAACAVMGCIEHESSWREDATNPFDGGFGVLQWTFERKSRLISWCNKYGYEASSLEGQMLFFRHELYNSYSETNGYTYPVCETLITSNDIEECLKMFFCHMEAGNNVSITNKPYSKHSSVTTQTLYNIRLEDAKIYYEDYCSAQ